MYVEHQRLKIVIARLNNSDCPILYKKSEHQPWQSQIQQ